MKSTGVTRKIDELGRIVIPKEIRKNLGIRDGESIEIYTNEDSIILKKYSEIKNYEELSNNICEIIKDIYKVDVIITDREKVITCTFNKNLVNKNISEQLINLIDNRELFLSKELNTINIDNEKIIGYFSIVPIIDSIDSLGLVIIATKELEEKIDLAKFLAKIIANKLI